MQNELIHYPDVETGGLLLGYVDDDRIKIIEATDGGYQNVLRTPDSFRYDETYELHLCALLCALYVPSLNVVGIWHKHNSINEVHFSHADVQLHEQLVAMNDHVCISILFERIESVDNMEYEMTAHLLEYSGDGSLLQKRILDSDICVI